VCVGKRSSPARLRKTIAAALDDPALERGAQTMAQALARSDGALEVADAVEAIGRARAC
jgi:UDP:flavonoid glycosyltransferase YjiC (YdhE family)